MSGYKIKPDRLPQHLLNVIVLLITFVTVTVVAIIESNIIYVLVYLLGLAAFPLLEKCADDTIYEDEEDL